MEASFWRLQILAVKVYSGFRNNIPLYKIILSDKSVINYFLTI